MLAQCRDVKQLLGGLPGSSVASKRGNNLQHTKIRGGSMMES